MNLSISTDEQTINNVFSNFTLTPAKNPLTQGIIKAYNETIYIKYREDNPYADITLNEITLDVRFKGDNTGTPYIDNGLQHKPNTLYYYNYYTGTTTSSVPSNYSNPKDYYPNNYYIGFTSNNSLQICITIPYTQFTQTQITDYSDNHGRYLIGSPIYIFRGDAPNSSLYDTLGHG